MKKYQKAEMIAKNLPTGSYAAGCPTGTRQLNGGFMTEDNRFDHRCSACEVAQ